MPALETRIVTALAACGGTLAVAESLTGGELTSRLVGVPGVSAVLRGAVVAYTNEVKTDLLDVEPRLLAEAGAVDGRVAAQMALGAARRLGADHAVATTGVAGPGPADGHPAGTVFVAACTSGEVRVRRLDLAGVRPLLRDASCRAALALLAGLLDDRGHRADPRRADPRAARAPGNIPAGAGVDTSDDHDPAAQPLHEPPLRTRGHASPAARERGRGVR